MHKHVATCEFTRLNKMDTTDVIYQPQKIIQA